MRPRPADLNGGLVAVLATATGLAVASNYYAQPLLPAMARSLHMSPGLAGLVVTAAQVGYALGLVLVVPLGDLVDGRRLSVILAAGTGLAMFGLAVAPSAPLLLLAAVVVGAVSVLAQVLVAFTASAATDRDRGRAVGTVMSGLLTGVLLARTVAGLLAESGTWRTVYWVAGAAMIIEAGLLHRRLPHWPHRSGLGYSRLIGSVAALLREEPILRLRCGYGFFSFGAFSVLWTSLAFLLARHYHLSSAVIGLFGLAGVAGVVTANVAGRLSDRGGATASTAVASALLLASWAALWAGHRSLVSLVVGIVVLDVGANGLHITNQGEIYRLRPEARSRLTSAYMFVYFAGGAAGSAASARLYGVFGWDGVCLAGAAFGAGAMALWLAARRRPTGSDAPGAGGMVASEPVNPLAGTSDSYGRYPRVRRQSHGALPPHDFEERGWR